MFRFEFLGNGCLHISRSVVLYVFIEFYSMLLWTKRPCIQELHFAQGTYLYFFLGFYLDSCLTRRYEV